MSSLAIPALSPQMPRLGSHARGGPALGLQTLCATPAVLGSLGVMLVATGWLRPWVAGLVLLNWLLAAAVLTGRAVERLTVRVFLGYRRPRPEESVLVERLRQDALARCSIRARDIDLYVRRRDAGVNAYATGGRSVALSRGLLEAAARGHDRPGEACAMLCHELGHLAAPGAALTLPLAWLSAPWRLLHTAGAAILRPILRRFPFHRVGWLLLPVVGIIAAIQAAAHHAWAALAVLISLGLLIWVQPAADAARRRAAEFAADRYARDAGLAPQLVDALSRHTTVQPPANLWARARHGHPTPEQRIARLRPAAVQASDARPGSASPRDVQKS